MTNTITQIMEYQQPQIPPFCVRTSNIECREYLRTGKCKFGNQCKFNHPAVNCRDYLRTGKCKYGIQCKYNHPPWVQTGGGIKERINPCKPLFPIRPSEPPCPYFLRYGTCKFGQTCKFHHPPSALNAAESDFILAQRPTEPDCIFFLKNGHCKFGSTCKFHHPLSVLGIINDPTTRTQASHMKRTDQFAYTMDINTLSPTTIPFQVTDTKPTVLLPVQTVYQEKDVHYVVRNAPAPQTSSTNILGSASPRYNLHRVVPPLYSNTMITHDEDQLNMGFSLNNSNHSYRISSQESRSISENTNEDFLINNNSNHSLRQSPQKFVQHESWSRVSEAFRSFQNDKQDKYHEMPSNDWKSYPAIEAHDTRVEAHTYPVRLGNTSHRPYERADIDKSPSHDTATQFKTLHQKYFDSPSSIKLKPNTNNTMFSPDAYNKINHSNGNTSTKLNETRSYQATSNDDDEALSKMTFTILNLIDTPSGSADNDNQLNTYSTHLYENHTISSSINGTMYQQASDQQNLYTSNQSLFTHTSKIL